MSVQWRKTLIAHRDLVRFTANISNAMKVSERRVRPRALSHVRSLNSYRIFQLMIGGALLCLIEGPCRVDGEYVGRSLQPIPSRSRIQMPIIKGLESVVLVPRGGDISPSAISSSSSATSLLDTLSDKPWKCWAFLFVSILTENVAASMIKAARVKKSFSLLAVACSWYLLG